MVAPENLPPTIDYGVTFERGLRIKYGDRSHLYISGTASINKEGKVLYHPDVIKQTQRTIENVRALLAPHGANLKDMAYLIFYLRNGNDKKKVLKVLKDEVPSNVPFFLVEGAVCRPTWLVEVEGMGVIRDSTVFPNFF